MRRLMGTPQSAAPDFTECCDRGVISRSLGAMGACLVGSSLFVVTGSAPTLLGRRVFDLVLVLAMAISASMLLMLVVMLVNPPPSIGLRSGRLLVRTSALRTREVSASAVTELLAAPWFPLEPASVVVNLATGESLRARYLSAEGRRRAIDRLQNAGLTLSVRDRAE